MKLSVITLLPLRSIGMKLCQLIFLSISTVPDGTVHSLIFLLFLQIFQIIIHALPEIEIISSHSLLQLQYTREQSIQEPDEGENGVQVFRKGDRNPDVVISDNGNGGEPIPNKDFPEPLSVSVGLDSMVKLYLIGFAIITFSVGVSSAAVMRLKPGEILAKMS